MKLYGPYEIAKACGVSQAAVSQWRNNGTLPKPYAVLARGPVWTGRQVGQFIRRRRERQ